MFTLQPRGQHKSVLTRKLRRSSGFSSPLDLRGLDEPVLDIEERDGDVVLDCHAHRGGGHAHVGGRRPTRAVVGNALGATAPVPAPGGSVEIKVEVAIEASSRRVCGRGRGEAASDRSAGAASEVVVSPAAAVAAGGAGDGARPRHVETGGGAGHLDGLLEADPEGPLAEIVDNLQAGIGKSLASSVGDTGGRADGLD